LFLKNRPKENSKDLGGLNFECCTKPDKAQVRISQFD